MHVTRLVQVGLIFAGQVVMGGHAIGNFGVPAQTVPAIGSVSVSASATTVVGNWNTAMQGTTSMACGLADGTFDFPAVDDTSTPATRHQSIVAGLQPSTRYFCEVRTAEPAGVLSGRFSVTTEAEDLSIPITGIALGSIFSYNSINAANRMNGDTFYNCRSSDGTSYLTTDDTQGWSQGGYPAPHGSPLSLVKFTSENPLAGTTVNPFAAYGPDSVGTGDDARTEKDSGLFCMAGDLYMTVGRQLNQSTGGMGNNRAYVQDAGQVIMSHDKGMSWNNFKDQSTFREKGSPTSPASASMFALTPTNMASATFVMYCADDGTLGYLVACNRHDNADAYVYLIANDGFWDSGNALYLARVPRAKMKDLNAADYQFYISGDGSQNGSWTNSQSVARAIIANPHSLGEPNVQYVPSLNRYLLLTYSYPQGLATAAPHAEHSQWLAYEAPHPWGPWTLVSSVDWPTQGFYNPVILNNTIYSGASPIIMFTGNFFESSAYQMYVTTLSILH